MNKGLYDSFAERWLNGGSVWLYSDPHFADPEMRFIRTNYIGDEEQIKHINSKVGANDTIIFLGDIGKQKFIRQVRGYKVLVMGNHDAGAANYRRHLTPVTFNSMEEMLHGLNVGQIDYVADSEIGTYKGFRDNKLFDEVYEGPLFIGDRLLLSHEPISLPYTLNIHGHDHSNWQPMPNCYNVCAELINYTPVCLSTILKSGIRKDIPTLHRITIDLATERSQQKLNQDK